MSNCQLVNSTLTMIEQCKESALNCEKMREEIIQLYKDGKMSKKIYFLNIKHIAKLIKSNNDILSKLPQRYHWMLKYKNFSSAGRDIYLPDMESCLENKKYTNKFLISTH